MSEMGDLIRDLRAVLDVYEGVSDSAGLTLNDEGDVKGKAVDGPSEEPLAKGTGGQPGGSASEGASVPGSSDELEGGSWPDFSGVASCRSCGQPWTALAELSGLVLKYDREVLGSSLPDVETAACRYVPRNPTWCVTHLSDWTIGREHCRASKRAVAADGHEHT